jgi:hypothetical protein
LEQHYSQQVADILKTFGYELTGEKLATEIANVKGNEMQNKYIIEKLQYQHEKHNGEKQVGLVTEEAFYERIMVMEQCDVIKLGKPPIAAAKEMTVYDYALYCKRFAQYSEQQQEQQAKMKR